MSKASQITVAVCGAMGKMGQEVIKTVLSDPALTLVAAIDHQQIGNDVAIAVGLPNPCGVNITEDLQTTLKNKKPHVCVDFTHPSSVLKNTLSMIEADCRPVIGTTGLSSEDLEQIKSALNQKKTGGLVVPNFAIGAVLLMKFAQEAAQYFDHAEIIELHHNKKADAPSGTAIKTAELMEQTLKQRGKAQFNQPEVQEKETIPGARGALGPGSIFIHSVRLPGLIAHQEVLFGSSGQILTLRHDSMDRQSFMPGVALAIKKVVELTGLTYGLEHIL